MKARLRAIGASARKAALGVVAPIRRSVNTTSALLAGWVMVATGFGLHDLGIGLIVAGVTLGAGAVIIAAGEEG